MNHPRSVYKTDFVPYDWMQNNFSSNADEFCSPENIDDCIQYISQEFRALGYPSIYLNNSCPSAVNCDIVTLLNVTFELLGCTKDHVQVKDDLESSNQRLCADIFSLNKKNVKLEDSVEILERKYRNILERERQIKEKNVKLTQAIKNEKDEARKLFSQIQQQKVAYQHEIRKYESNVNQLKARLKQILADKNPDKKVVIMSASNLLQRNSKERGKWKTGTVAKSSMEEMYSSLILSYENRSQEMMKEIIDYQNCLTYIQNEMQVMIALLKDDECNKITSNSMPLHVIWSAPNKLKELTERFKSLLCEIRDSATEIKNNLKTLEDMHQFKSELTQYDASHDEKEPASLKFLVGRSIENSLAEQDSEYQKNMLQLERKKLHEKEKALSATAMLIEKEKAHLESQRLEVIKMAMKQDSAKSDYYSNLKSSPSFSVITTSDGLTSVPSASQLKQCHSMPSQHLRTLSPLWNMAHFVTSEELKAKSGDMVQPSLNYTIEPSTSQGTQHTYFPTDGPPCRTACSLDSNNKKFGKPLEAKSENMVQPSLNYTIVPSTSQGTQLDYFPTGDLPCWTAYSLDSDTKELGNQSFSCDSLSNEELDLSNMTLSEDQNLDRFKAAVRDMEMRRNYPSY